MLRFAGPVQWLWSQMSTTKAVVRGRRARVRWRKIAVRVGKCIAVSVGGGCVVGSWCVDVWFCWSLSTYGVFWLW